MRTTLLLTLLLAPLFVACGGGDSEAASGTGGGLDGATVAQQRCSLCHHLDGSQSMFAPGLPTVIGQARARVADYAKTVDELKSLSESTYVDARETIDAILATKDDEARLRLWLRAHVKNPRFDNPASRMAPVAVSEREFDALWSYLRTIR